MFILQFSLYACEYMFNAIFLDREDDLSVEDYIFSFAAKDISNGEVSYKFSHKHITR